MSCSGKCSKLESCKCTSIVLHDGHHDASIMKKTAQFFANPPVEMKKLKELTVDADVETNLGVLADAAACFATWFPVPLDNKAVQSKAWLVKIKDYDDGDPFLCCNGI